MSNFRFPGINKSCVGIRRRRLESSEKRNYQLNGLCHSNQRLKWIMSNVLWCSRSHNLATKWLPTLYRTRKRTMARETGRITFTHRNPVGAARQHKKRTFGPVLCLWACCKLPLTASFVALTTADHKIHPPSLSLAPGGVCVTATLVQLVRFLTLSGPQLGERDRLCYFVW